MSTEIFHKRGLRNTVCRRQYLEGEILRCPCFDARWYDSDNAVIVKGHSTWVLVYFSSASCSLTPFSISHGLFVIPEHTLGSPT